MEGRHGGHVLYDGAMSVCSPAARHLRDLLVLAPAALAHDGGEGTYGEADDKVVTNAGFIVIVVFPLFILVMSLLQGAWTGARTRARVPKARAGSAEWRGGW